MIDTIRNLIRLNNPRYWQRWHDVLLDGNRFLQRRLAKATKDLADANRALGLERAAHRVTAKRLEEMGEE